MTTWERLGCTGTPNARYENGFAEFDGKFYLFGGRRIQPVDSFGPLTRVWTNHSPPPMEIQHFQPVIIKDELWLLRTMTDIFPRKTALETV